MTVTMGAFIVYIIKSSLLLAMLVSLFMLFMSRETFHRLNRYLLLCIVVVSLGLPLVNIGVNTPLQGVFDFIENGGRTTDENVLVDGEFKDELKDNKAHWVGSTNQRVIDIPLTLKENKVIIRRT